MNKRKKKGIIIVIGGHEDKTNHGEILNTIAQKIGTGILVVLPFGSGEPEEMIKIYKAAFRTAGVKHLYFINLENREDAKKPEKLKLLEKASGVFFTGGDQNKINSLIAYTPFCDRIRNIYEHGGIIAGTSAGASVLSQTMLVYPNHRINQDYDHNEFDMAPGLALLPSSIIIDQHFSQRSRFGRLLSAVAKNPSLLGVGLDENTAIMVEGGNRFRTLGKGLVYIFDGANISFMDLRETAYNMCVHIMAHGYEFDLTTRRPIIPKVKLKIPMDSEVY